MRVQTSFVTCPSSSSWNFAKDQLEDMVLDHQASGTHACKSFEYKDQSLSAFIFLECLSFLMFSTNSDAYQSKSNKPFSLSQQQELNAEKIPCSLHIMYRAEHVCHFDINCFHGISFTIFEQIPLGGHQSAVFGVSCRV